MSVGPAPRSVGKQDETVVVKWFPGESDGVDGSGITTASSPTLNSTEELAAVYADQVGSSTLVLARGEIAASGVIVLRGAEAYTDILHTRLVASGVLPV